PDAEDARTRDREDQQGVWLSGSTDRGLRDVLIRTDFVSAAWLDASLDRIAGPLRPDARQEQGGPADVGPSPSTCGSRRPDVCGFVGRASDLATRPSPSRDAQRGS